MKINIILITYNQQQYIRQAVESILMQRFDGEVNIIVADDSSTDDTLNIIRSYEPDSPFEFIYLPKEKNIGHSKNYYRAFVACDGDYIAILEGDDYWTSPFRLQKHVDFLDKHRECVLSMNKLIFYWQDEYRFQIQDWDGENYIQYITSQQMAIGNNLGNLSACVIRKSIFNKLSPQIFDVVFDDWLLGIALGEYGFLCKLNEPLSVYRKHQNGLWSQIDTKESLKILEERIKQYNPLFNYRYTNEFQQQILSFHPIKRRLSLKQKMKLFLPPCLIYLYRYICPPIFTKKQK
jgi:Glycosyltransferases involved in cell wall biogenesis